MLLDIVEEHLEEIETLWSLRRLELTSSAIDLTGLAEVDERLEAHIDGVAVAGEWALARMATVLCRDDPDAAFAAAACLLRAGGARGRESVWGTLESGSIAARAGVTEALCYLALAAESRSVLEAVLEGEPLRAWEAAVETLGRHGVLEPAAIVPGVESPDARVRAAAARALGRVGGNGLETLAANDDAHVRDDALVAAARAGLPWALDRLRTMCRDPELATHDAVRLLGSLGDCSDVEVLCALSARRSLGEAALAALGTLGRVECADALLDLARDTRLTRGAVAAFHRITGIELRTLRVAEDYDDWEDLRPEPDVGALRACWRERAAGFDPAGRWRNGLPLIGERWLEEPHAGDLLTRREELTRLRAGRPGLFSDLELDAPARRQFAAAGKEEACPSRT